MQQKQKNKLTEAKKEEPIKLNMTFEKAMSKALSTPLPTKKKDKKKS
jgi:hypothetical protein